MSQREIILSQIEELSEASGMELKWNKIYTADVPELERVLGLIKKVNKLRNN